MDEALVYINGKPKLVDNKEIFSFISKNRSEIHRPSNEGPAICFPDGSEHYYENGNLHRIDGPALIDANRRVEYYIRGKLHREDGPAVKYSDGDEEWFVNGKIHRLDGPAIIHTDGSKKWYLDGKKYSQKQWLKEREKWLEH